MKEFILTIIGLDKDTRKELSLKDFFTFTGGTILFLLIIGLIQGFIERI